MVTKKAAPTPTPNITNAIHIGADGESVQNAAYAILEILNVQHVDHQTRIEAIKALSTMCRVENTTIQNCNFQIGEE